ncbi:MAG: peptidylprolyl isomerase, partial [bacterium]
QGSGPKQGIIASINGVDITAERLDDLIQQQNYTEQNKNEADLTEEQVKQIRSEVWDELIRDMLIDMEIRKQGIRATNKEIAFLLQNAPPQFIRENEHFQTNGQFDQQKYQEFLRNPAAARDLIMIEQSYRENLPSQKFINRLLSMAFVSEQELWQSYQDDNLRGKARYVAFSTASVAVDSAAVTAKRVEDYYAENREKYKLPEKRRIIYALFQEEPSAEDSAAVRHLTDELLQRIRKGEDFAKLAKEFSDDRSAEKGGDLGFFERGRMIPEFEAAAFGATVGEIAGPVLSKFGYHIIQVTDRKTEEGVEKVRASHILLKIEASMETKESARNSASALADEIKATNFYEAAKLFDIAVDTTDYFEDRDFIPGVGRLPSAVDFIFASPVGTSSMVYPVRDGSVVFQVLDTQKERYQTLDEVRTGIVAHLLSEDRIEQTGKLCQEFYQNLGDPSAFVEKVQMAGLSVKETEREFRFNDYVRDVGRDPAFNSAALSLEMGQVSKPVRGQQAYYIIQLTEKTLLDSTAFLTQKEEIRQRLLTSKQNLLYSQWLETAKKKADIEDYRYLYYRDY